MNNLKSTIVSELATETGLQIYYEAFTMEYTLPCITYLPITDYSVFDSNPEDINKVRYSRPSFRIKLYGTDMANMETTKQIIDGYFYDHNYRRISYSEESIDNGNVFCYIFQYDCLYEEHNITNN